MKITIDTIDDAYFFLADKTESFGCKYHKHEVEFLFINRLMDNTVNLFDVKNRTILEIDGKFFDETFDIIGHPIYLGLLSDMIENRINKLREVTTDEEFARYVYLGKFIVQQWVNKDKPLEQATNTEELFANLIKLIGDFFDDPKPSGYKVTKKIEEDAQLQAEMDATEKLLPSKKSKKGKKNSS